MKIFNAVSLLSDLKSRPWLSSLFIAATLIIGVFFFASVARDYKRGVLGWGTIDTMKKREAGITESSICKSRCRDQGTEALPEGIVAKASNLEMRPLWGSDMNDSDLKPSINLLAVAAGIKQKKVVNMIVEKFLLSNFTVMLFHYDGIVDDWRDLEWCDRAIHISGLNQTKWWFAKRFLHPDIVAEYDYIFLWDEDLGVENFDPTRYLSIVKDEGLEISQPALDPVKSRVHHQLTARLRGSKVHRRIYKLKGNDRCDENSTAPPCIGWVEMMAPVFTRKAWRCSWYMIQNDLIHAWGLDVQLGYCAQGDRKKNVGVVDSEYIVHLSLPTLGVLDGNEALSESHVVDNRSAVRWQSFKEMQIFKKRWNEAVKEDACWIDPYQHPVNHSKY